MQRNIPRKLSLVDRIIYDAVRRTMHGGVILTMTVIMENYWIPKLQQIAKRVIRKCFGCQWFHPKPFTSRQKSILPSDRATGIRPFQLIGTHFAGLIMYCNKNKGEKKTYILLLTCSLIRTVHVELLQDQTTDEFITALKRLTSRRGLSETLYSDNANIYVAVSKLINKSEILHHLLTTRCMK